MHPKCGVCRDYPAAIGSKCGYCYVREHAQRRGLWDRKWFQLQYALFVNFLTGRFWAIEQGLTPGDIESLVHTIRRDAKRRPVNKASEQKLRAIISAADKLAEKRRRHHEDARDRSEEEGREVAGGTHR